LQSASCHGDRFADGFHFFYFTKFVPILIFLCSCARTKIGERTDLVEWVVEQSTAELKQTKLELEAAREKLKRKEQSIAKLADLVRICIFKSESRPEGHRGSIGSRSFYPSSAPGRPESVHRLIPGADWLWKRVEPNPLQFLVSAQAAA